MERKFQFTVLKKDLNQTVKEFLRKQGFSGSFIRKLKKQEAAVFLIDSFENEEIGVSHILKNEGTLEVYCREEQLSVKIEPVFMKLDILFEDEDFIVLNKPSGCPVHISYKNYNHTLANGLAYYYKKKGEAFVCRAVNRLDKDTTGVLLFSKNAVSSSILNEMMKKREIARTYLAVVKGVVKGEGTIDAPIARIEGSILERTVDFERGERAVTHYKAVADDGEDTLLKIHLDTGRTHQIRVHMKYMGHPVMGDFLYYPDYSKITRQALHSYSLELIHPFRKEKMKWTAPLPEDMKFLNIEKME